VDDDAVFLKSLEIEFLHHIDFIVETYVTGELHSQSRKKPDVIILDYHLDGIDKNAMNGIETLDKIKEYDSDIPVMMLSSQDKIDVAISCMHHKAFDYKRDRFFYDFRKTSQPTSILRESKRIKLVYGSNVDSAKKKTKYKIKKQRLTTSRRSRFL
jgi:DNA-binding NtrC family response regulator